jgi:protein arginine kinase activator
LPGLLWPRIIVMAPCERCGKPGTVTVTDISNGKRTEHHLCDQCAQEAGYVTQSHVPINELLNPFLKAHAQMADTQSTRCPECGMSWQEFKDTGLLGCYRDYALFEPQLSGVIERAQNGGTHHTGKNPPAKGPGRTSDAVKLRQAELQRLRRELARAVEDESYEQAARLRDQIKVLERNKAE